MTAVVLADVASSLRLGHHEFVSLVGGGGKTTLLFALGRQLPGRVLLTSTTKMEADCAGRVTTLMRPTVDVVDDALDHHRVVLAMTGPEEGKLRGVPPAAVDRWFDLADHVVVEADGSRGRPATAPAPHEPPIPSRTTRVLAVMGADALGRVVADCCHRPLRVAALAGCSPYHRLTPAGAYRVLDADRGMRKNVPEGARYTVVITKVDRHDDALACELAGLLAAGGIDHVLVLSPIGPSADGTTS